MWERNMEFSATALLKLFAVLFLCGRLSAQVYHLSLSVEEASPAGTVVGDINAALPARLHRTGFFLSHSRDSLVFRDLEIDGESGVVSTKAVLDRESRDRYEFSAATLAGEVIKIKIVVTDVNDNCPEFPVKTVEVNVSELSPPGTRFELHGAPDQDEGRYGTQGYRIKEDIMQDIFNVEANSDGLNIDLVLMKKLDREIRDFYSLTIEAFDGGVPPKSGQLEVRVNILDENDNQPVFNQTEYRVEILENVHLLAPVCQVYAEDPDLGHNGLVTYEINRLQSDPNEFFVIDRNTGIIRVNKYLDYESQSYFELVVTARDHGAPPESSSTIVGIRLLDVNDNSLHITVLFLSETGDPEISEGAGYGVRVASISVSDADLGNIDTVRLSLKGGEGKFALNRIDEFLFALCVDGPLDREQKDLYELTVSATDLGSPPLRSSRTFFLRVTDVNDNRPVFEWNTYEASVPEDAPEGSSILRVKAHDDDEDSGIFYSILQSEQDLVVNIDPNTGLITTSAGLDREREPGLAFLVVAVDGGFPPLTSTATVSIRVEDVNDNKPVFKQQLYNVTIQEHLAIGTCFLQVSAEDDDGSEFGIVRYSFSDGEDTNSFFHIDPVTGQICISQDIDRDVGLASFDLLVKAEDYGGLKSESYLHIDVEDMNDNPPVFNPDQYHASISSHAHPGDEILSVVATDRDSGSYGQITYELVLGDFSSLFSVDQSTGAVSLSAPLSHLDRSTIKLSVSAHDGQGLAAPTPADLTITVLQTDHAPALFQESQYSFSVPEDTPPNTYVGTVQAVSPSNSVESLSYRIFSGGPQDLFSVDAQSGAISTSLTLDHETLPWVLLTLQARMGTSPIYTSTHVNITITDTNDNPPVFQKTSDTITVSRNTPPGTTLFTAHAHDRDSGSNGRIRYALRPESRGFSIDPRLGTLTLNDEIWRDAARTYKLSVVAEDEGTPSLNSSLSLVVELDHSDPAEGALAFETLLYQVEIGENAQRDTRVIQVRAHGSRSLRRSGAAPSAPLLSYTLEPLSRPPPFSVQPDSGWLFVARGLDYESEPSYRFTVRATASDGHVELTATATVVVTVQDENDNAPVFERDRYFFSVPEGLDPHGRIGTVKATDRDSRKNGQLSYILLSDGKHFRINSETGELINWRALDREEHCHHSVRVMVTDHGHPRLNATATVHILVTDINDNPPEFTNLPANRELRVQAWSGLPAGSVVTSVYANDLDAGPNGTVRFSLSSGSGHFEIDRHSGDIKVTSQFLRNPQTSYTLSVVAMDTGPAPLQQTALVHVEVYGSPKEHDFPGPRHFTVKENASLGTIVGCLRFSGGPKKKWHYSIVEGNGSSHFGVDTVSGELYVTQPLDYEATQVYVLAVQTEAPPTDNAVVLVSVGVEDVNDHTPWFPGDDSVVVFGVQEDAVVGTAVYAFKALDGDGTLRNSEIRYTMTYDPNPDMKELPFTIDPHTGVVTTTEQLDYERTRSFAFSVTASNHPNDQRHASVTAQAFLLDVNDNSPAFVSMDTVHVAEDTEVGSLLHHSLATDKDAGPNSHVTYCLIGGNEDGHFHLERTGHLYLNSSLDYESQHAFVLTVQASDSGLPPLSSTCSLTVVVVDVNDEAPLFEQHVYNASVMENEEAGQRVVTVRALDQDSEENAVLSYSLLPGPGYEFFSIDSRTGLITTSTQLDRELQHSFTLRVQAEDGGTRPLTSTATVFCSVLDENDNAPEFSQPSSHIVIPENLPPGVIHTVHAHDPDCGMNGTVEYSIHNPSDHFSVDAVTGAISTSGVLDREECPNYTLLITASDQGPSTLTSTLLLFISLTDENDNSPAFSSRSYRTSASEGLPVGSEILSLTAQDPDEGRNGEVTFSLADETSGTFAVDPSTGVVRLTKPLDRETRSQHDFRAVATDSSVRGPRSSVVTITVQVDDVNDNLPVCTSEPVRVLDAAGSGRPGQLVTTLTAIDPDQGENGTVEFGLAEEDALFRVDQSSGEVRLRAPVGEAERGSRLLSVWAADRGTPALTSTCLLLVQLSTEDSLLQFTEWLYEVTVPENSKTGSWVANVVADDQTAGSVIKYSVFSAPVDGAFSIHPDTGDITVRDQSLLDFEMEHQVHLVVLAENGRQSAYARVSVTLQDVNDNTPVFKQSYYRTAVWEEQIHSTYVTQVLAMDSDSGVNGQIDYIIVNGNHDNAFIIDSVRGILATNAVLDRETTDSYKLTLEARDRGSPPLTGTCTVRVQVMDVNDNSPTIPTMAPLVVPENLPAGHIISQVVASDVDLSSTITYGLSAKEEAEGFFAIDRFSGVITSNRSLDHEEQVQHTLTVLASDSIHQTEALITIQVLDVNDNAPEFSQELYQVFLPELTSADSFVVAVMATDKDSGLNGKISYRLLSSPMSGFYINTENGSIYTNKPLTYVSSSDVIQILVEARDSGDPTLFSVTSVDIQVVDSNDHAPFFLNYSYQVSVCEDVPAGSVVLTLLSEDQDYSDENTHLDYIITEGNEEGRFCIEMVSVPKRSQQRTVGNVVLCDILDRETTETYSLTVTVMDRGMPSLNSSTVVSVTVLDINDNEPVFSNSEYYAHVTENSPLGTALVQVFAQDRDLGPNGTVRYDVISGNSKGLFRLNSQTGALEVNGTLDFEEDSSHVLAVRASDGGGPGNRQVSFAVIYITVLDENDNSPFFVFPTINCSVAENLPAFSPVCVIHAIDQDAGSFGILTYSIVTSCFMDYRIGSPGKKEPFAIDPLTGHMRTRETFNYERQSEYCFVVEARDKGNRAATVMVQIAVDGVDEFSPVFSQNLYHFVLPDNARVGQRVGHVMAMDHDGGLDGVVVYSLASPSPFFNINKTTGSIYISNPVYRKAGMASKEEVAKLMVLARSPKLDSRSATCHVVVNISKSAEALTDVALSIHTVKLSVSLTVFLLLLISSIALILRYKTKSNIQKKTASLSPDVSHRPETSGILRRDPQNRIIGMKLQALHTPLNMQARREMCVPLRISDTSGRGSAEGETAEDQDIKMVSEGHCPKQRVVTDLYVGVPTEDRLSCCSVNLGAGKMVEMSSVESLHNFKEEGGGEGMLLQPVSMREIDGVTRGCMFTSNHQDFTGGSLTSLISSEEQLCGTNGWDHLNQETVFSDLERLQGRGGEVVRAEFHSLLPQRTGSRGRPSNSKFSYSLWGRNGGHTSAAMTSNVSPSLSLLALRTPDASPVVSETGLGSFRKITPLSTDVLENAGLKA
ncbi:protocadherin-23 [Brachyhypopomus gauderio]|uniref:protocadherin-23 n=1 Tax=Brachyhypopomus gauderio TaxID=698409 RepID=UPI0040437A4A